MSTHRVMTFAPADRARVEALLVLACGALRDAAVAAGRTPDEAELLATAEARELARVLATGARTTRSRAQLVAHAIRTAGGDAGTVAA